MLLSLIRSRNRRRCHPSVSPRSLYRITIRLAGADPAAPAEAVTRALREADVGFAVERIERVEP